MADEEELRIIREIARKYGTVLDLEATPSVLAEILRNYGSMFSGGRIDPLGTSVQGGQGSSVGGVDSTGTGTVGGGTTGGVVGEVGLHDIMRGILQLQRAVSLVDTQLKEVLTLQKKG